MKNSEYPLITDSYTSDHVANYFIQKAAKEDYPIDLLKLTKLPDIWCYKTISKRLKYKELVK